MRELLHRTVKRLGGERRLGDRRGPVVLLYHRLGPVVLDPQLLSVKPDHFAEHLQLISERYVPLRLADLAAAAAEGRAPARAVAIAFDDGYADNLLAAKPLLETSGMPATVFVASGYVQTGQPFWWDELERLLLRPGRLPSILSLTIGDETLTWNLGGDAASASRRGEKPGAWTVFDGGDPGPRQRIYRDLCSRLRVLDHFERDRTLEQLRSVAEPDVAGKQMPRPLAVAEVQRLAEGDLIEVGAHSVTHPALAQLPPERQRE